MSNKEYVLNRIKREKDQGAIVYVMNDNVTSLGDKYEIEVTTLNFKEDDFFKIPGGGKFYPLKPAQNAIAEAAGISFTDNSGTKEEGVFSKLKYEMAGKVCIIDGDFSIVGWAQGTKKQSDGTLRMSSVLSYEYSVTDRGNRDILNSIGKVGYNKEDKTIRTEIMAMKKALEHKMFARRKASTGAQLAVIRELVGMPTGYTAEEIKKPMVFYKVIESQSYKEKEQDKILALPGGVEAIANARYGATKALFGNQAQPVALQASNDVTIDDLPIEEAETTECTPVVEDFPEEIKPVQEDPKEIQREELKMQLRELIEQIPMLDNVKNKCQKALDDKKVQVSYLETIINYITQHIKKGA